MPLTMGVFALSACSLAGIPLFAGFASKWYLLLGGAEISALVPALFVASGALNVAYFWPIVYGAFFESPATADPKPLVTGPLGGGGGDPVGTPPTWHPIGTETRPTILVSLGVLVVLVVALGVRPDVLAVFDLAVQTAENAIGGSNT